MDSDEALYERLLRGDLTAFDRLYERYERRLFGFIRRYLGANADAEDVLQETFLTVVRVRGAGRTAISFRAWLYQVARNQCLNRLRSSKRAQRAFDAMAGDALAAEASAEPAVAEVALLEVESRIALDRAVARLPAALGEVYSLRSGGLSYDEMAEVLAVPLGTIKSRMHDLIARLRKDMKR